MALSNISALQKGPDPNWEYCGVKLTIHNIIIPVERLSPTPSQVDKMNPEMEIDLRIIGCELIQDSGVLLKLPQVAMATAQVLYQRFFYSKSFVRHFYEHYAMACVFLAAKLEECPRRIRDIINVFHHMRQVREKKTPTPVMLDQSYTNLKNQIIKAERRVLKELGFCVHAKHPHKLVICYLQALGQQSNSKFVQTAWNYMNDSLRTDVFVRYLPEAIACACIYLASCKLGIPLPRHPAWWEMFTVDEESVREIALCLVRLYARPKANIAELEAELAKLRKSQVEAKEREIELKKAQSSVTPDHASDQSSVNLSPQTDTATKKAPVTAKCSSGVVGDTSASVPDVTQSLPPNSILASALATAKAVAASITASKTGSVSGVKGEPEPITNNGSNRLDEVSMLEDVRNNRAGPTRRASKTSPDSRQTSKRSTLSASTVRPAAYPHVSPERILEHHKEHRERKRKVKHRSSHRRPSPSPSSSSSSSVENGRTHAYSSGDRCYRNNRPKASILNDQTSSGSGTPSVSPSPPKRHKTGLASLQNHRRLSRSSSVDSHSSLSSGGSLRARSNTDKKPSSHPRRQLSPPAAYRLDKTDTIPSDNSSKSRLSSKVYLSNGATRHSESRSHHRHHESTDRRQLLSREHRRR